MAILVVRHTGGAIISSILKRYTFIIWLLTIESANNPRDANNNKKNVSMDISLLVS